MPRFFGKKGPRGGSRAGVKQRPKKSAPRRRLPAVSTVAGAIGAGAVIKRAYNNYKARQTKAKNSAVRAFTARLAQTDNITTATPVVIGKQRPVSFQEKVSRSIRGPVLFKRNYAFNAECVSGKKAMFCMDINQMTANDLTADLSSYKSVYTTDTATADASIRGYGSADQARYYIDKLNEKIQMINSSSNSITGKIHLFAHKRDTSGTYSSANVNPVNLLMFYSTGAPQPQVADAGGSQTVGNGWVFSNGGGNTGVNFATTYNMPGSSVNLYGLSAIMDPALDFTSATVKDGINFWFRKVSTSSFALKPGQQFNSSFVFNDLPVLNREEQIQFIHLAGVSYSLVVEFRAGIVGSAVADGVVSTGDAQLSVIRESTRTLGMKNTLQSKVLLQTAPLATIAIANQVIINADTGVGLSGAVLDV